MLAWVDHLMELAARRLDGTMAEEPNDKNRGDWTLWPPSPKVQILLIAGVFGLINLCLLAIWAYVMYREFG